MLFIHITNDVLYAGIQRQKFRMSHCNIYNIIVFSVLGINMACNMVAICMFYITANTTIMGELVTFMINGGKFFIRSSRKKPYTGICVMKGMKSRMFLCQFMHRYVVLFLKMIEYPSYVVPSITFRTLKLSFFKAKRNI